MNKLVGILICVISGFIAVTLDINGFDSHSCYWFIGYITGCLSFGFLVYDS